MFCVSENEWSILRIYWQIEILFFVFDRYVPLSILTIHFKYKLIKNVNNQQRYQI